MTNTLTVAVATRRAVLRLAIAAADGPALLLEVTRPRRLARGQRRVTVVASVDGAVRALTHVTPGDAAGLEHWLRQLMVAGELPHVAAPHRLAALLGAACEHEAA
jgi:hypothetical protein